MTFVAKASPQLEEVVKSLAGVGPVLKSALVRYSSQYILPAWNEELGRSGGTATQHKILEGGSKALAHELGLTLIAAGSPEPLSGGAVPVEVGRAFEFGTADHTPRTYFNRRGGKVFKVTRVTTNQMPGRSRTGWVVYPAAARAGARLMDLAVQTVVRTLRDAAEGKSS